VVTFSAITDVDNPEIYSSRRAFTHIGDAQAAALAQRLVDSTRKEKAALAPNAKSFREDVDYVNIGGPAFNSATRDLFVSLSEFWSLPFEFCTEGKRWILRGPNSSSFHLKLSENREVQEDIGLVAKLPHYRATDLKDNDGFAMVLGGLSTYGTLGATTFAADPNNIKVLRKFLKPYTSRDRRYFCALVRVSVRRDSVGIETQSHEFLDVRPVTRKNRTACLAKAEA
jgi:hypothetical protein